MIFKFEEIWSESKLDVSEVFYSIELVYVHDPVVDLLVENMTEMDMMIDTRPSYPSNKLTFTIADFTKDDVIHSFNIFLNLNDQYDVDVVLEDSKRNFLNSFRFFF